MATVDCKRYNYITESYDTVLETDILPEDFISVHKFLLETTPVPKFYKVVLTTDNGTTVSFLTVHPDPLSYIKAKKEWQAN